MSTIRAFVAIHLPLSIRSLLNDTQDELREQIPAKIVRWVPTKNIHLTLKFLGETEVDRLSTISKALDLITIDHSPFNLELSQLGCFPNPRNPRIVWVGIHADTEELMTIQQRIANSLRPLGWKPERRNFHPHLTLGRVKDSRQLVAARLPWGQQITTEKFIVDSITLFESHLHSSGAIYIARHNSQLRGLAK
jgi:2'-5' RNA ligase